jgi:hypothetical protein
MRKLLSVLDSGPRHADAATDARIVGHAFTEVSDWRGASAGNDPEHR